MKHPLPWFDYRGKKHGSYQRKNARFTMVSTSVFTLVRFAITGTSITTVIHLDTSYCGGLGQYAHLFLQLRIAFGILDKMIKKNIGGMKVCGEEALADTKQSLLNF
ncbi:hypothetical protein [Bacillus cereus]|uniref:hypothetical protein n=1 Tax=Bacillus cereus TaxID=1396 RepID=UPI002111F02E|nr:hypothetical protein [Bacillus cereus]